MTTPKIEANIVRVDSRTARLTKRGSVKFSALPREGEVLTGIVATSPANTGYMVVQVNHNFENGVELTPTIIVEQKRCL